MTPSRPEKPPELSLEQRLRLRAAVQNMAERSEEIVEEVVAAWRREIPSYRKLDIEDVRHEARLFVKIMLSGIAANPQPAVEVTRKPLLGKGRPSRGDDRSSN